MSIQHVAIIGANGTLGPYVLRALLDSGVLRVTVLTRRSSKSQYDSTVTLKQIDDELPGDQLVSALRGCDALIMTFWGSEVETSNKLADAAFDAGVKVVIPADFGSCDSSDPQTLDLLPLYRHKKAARDHIVELSQRQRPGIGPLTWMSLVNGHFWEQGLSLGLFFIDTSNKTVRIFDGGNIRFSNSTLADIGSAIVKMLQNATHPRLKNQLVCIQSLSVTQNQLVEAFEGAKGIKLNRAACSSADFIRDNKTRVPTNGSYSDASRNLVAIEGIINADWQEKSSSFVNDLLGITQRNVEDLISED